MMVVVMLLLMLLLLLLTHGTQILFSNDSSGLRIGCGTIDVYGVNPIHQAADAAATAAAAATRGQGTGKGHPVRRCRIAAVRAVNLAMTFVAVANALTTTVRALLVITHSSFRDVSVFGEETGDFLQDLERI